MVDFSKLKKNSGKGALEKLTSELAKFNQPADNGKDNRMWYPSVDKAGNGYAVIRFLPAPGEEEVPFVRIFEHGFKGPTGSWYIENSLTTIGKPDPVSEMNSKLWNMSSDDDSPSRKQARAQKRKLGYICNVYVIQDQANPENNGKVFLFKFGKKIYDKLNDAMHPQFPGDVPMNPFDFWAGADFKLKIRNVDGYRNYDKSEFSPSAPLFDEDERMEAVWKQQHSLQAFLAPSNFKTYEELKAKLDKVLGLQSNGNATPAAARQAAAQKQSDADEDLPWQEPKAQKAAAPKNDEDDEDLEFFRRLSQ